MKTLPSGLQDHLDSGATTLCWCWQLTRRDAAVLGFTDHDRALTFDGVTYEAVSGFSASEVESALGLSVDNLTLAGALSSSTLNEDDLAAGLYDNAAFALWRVNWADTAQRVLMKSGTLGEVTRQGSAFQAELRGLAQQLNQPVGRAFGRLCDADLGDARCSLAISAVSGAVTTAFDARRFAVSGLDSATPGDFTGGRLSFTSGANAGRAMAVGSGDGTTTQFALGKTYASGPASWRRAIAKPVDGSVRVAVAGTELTSGFACDATTGIVTFDAAPAADAAIMAGFAFDTPVRFDTTTLSVNLAGFASGELASIPLVEILL